MKVRVLRDPDYCLPDIWYIAQYKSNWMDSWHNCTIDSISTAPPEVIGPFKDIHFASRLGYSAFIDPAMAENFAVLWYRYILDKNKKNKQRIKDDRAAEKVRKKTIAKSNLTRAVIFRHP